MTRATLSCQLTRRVPYCNTKYPLRAWACFCEGVQRPSSAAPFRLVSRSSLGISLLANSRCAPAHSQRSGGGAVEDRGANESSGAPRPMPREPATPTSYGPARRGAALLCCAFPARRDEALRGALGIGGDRRGCVARGCCWCAVLCDTNLICCATLL